MRTGTMLGAGCCLAVASAVLLALTEEGAADPQLPQEVPPGELGRVVRMGKEIVENTAEPSTLQAVRGQRSSL